RHGQGRIARAARTRADVVGEMRQDLPGAAALDRRRSQAVGDGRSLRGLAYPMETDTDRNEEDPGQVAPAWDLPEDEEADDRRPCREQREQQGERRTRQTGHGQ